MKFFETRKRNRSNDLIEFAALRRQTPRSTELGGSHGSKDFASSNLFLGSHSDNRRPRHLFSSDSTSTFSSITMFGTRRFARAELRRCLVRFDRARSRWLTYDSNCR
jgi:hypothetical protein